jgi:hypothetical protein
MKGSIAFITANDLEKQSKYLVGSVCTFMIVNYISEYV